MPIKFKLDIMKALKEAGYSSFRIRKEKIFGQSMLTSFRKGEAIITSATLDSLCKILNRQPGDILEYVEEGQTAEEERVEERED